MLSRLWSGVKSYAVPSVVTTCQLVSSAGTSFYIIPKFIEFILGEDDPRISIPVSTILVAGTVITLITSRSSSVFNHFSDDHKDEEMPEVKTIPGKIALHLFTGIGVYSALNSALSNYFFSLVLMQKVVDAFPHNPSRHEDLSQMPLAQGVASMFFVAKSVGNYSFVVKRSRLNVSKMISELEKRYYGEHNDEPFIADKRAFGITVAATSVGSIALPFFVYFSSSATLEKIPYIKISEEINHFLASSFAVSTIFTHLTTSPFSLHGAIKKRRLRPNSEPMQWWEYPANAIVYTAMSADFAGTGISNFTGFTNTGKRVFGINPKNEYFLALAVTGSTSSALLNFFQSREGYLESKRPLRGRVIEAKPSSEEDKPLLEDENAGEITQATPKNIVKPDETVNIDIKVHKHHAAIFIQNKNNKKNDDILIEIDADKSDEVDVKIQLSHSASS